MTGFPSCAVLADIRSPHGFVVGRDGRHDAVIVAGLVSGGRQHVGREDPEVDRDGAALAEVVRIAEDRLVDECIDGDGAVDRQALAGQRVLRVREDAAVVERDAQFRVLAVEIMLQAIQISTALPMTHGQVV